MARGRARVQFGGPQGRRDRHRPRRRRRAAGRHRPSMPVGGARADGDRRLSEDRQIRSLPRQQGGARARGRDHRRACRCPPPIRCTARTVRSNRSGAEDNEASHVRLALVLGRRTFDLRQCAPQGRALPRDRRSDRGVRAVAGGARARLRQRRRHPCRPRRGGRRRGDAVRRGAERARRDGGALRRQSAHQGDRAGRGRGAAGRTARPDRHQFGGAISHRGRADAAAGDVPPAARRPTAR